MNMTIQYSYFCNERQLSVLSIIIIHNDVATFFFLKLFERSFLLDMAVVSNATHDRKHADTALEKYVTYTLTDIITTFFKSPFSDQSTTVQTRQSVFVQLLGAAFRVAQVLVASIL